MSATRGGLTLVLQILGLGANNVAWRLPDSPVQRHYDIDLYTEVARQAEAAAIHALFLSDGLTTSASRPSGHFEPITFLTALAARTSRIGVVATASTTYNEPFNLARQLSSLDHLSGGRAGWNIVTSAWGEENFGLAPIAHADRYRRAQDFVAAATDLWESWDADARIEDKAAGLRVDAAKVSETNHVSEHFRIRGPLNIDRAPQGRPFLYQAGSSIDGFRLGARWADAIFAAQPDPVLAVDFYDEFKSYVCDAGRNPQEVRVTPGAYMVIGESSAHARELADALAELAGTADFDSQRKTFEKAGFGGADLSGLDPDQPIPLDRLPAVETVQGRRSRYELYRARVLRGGVTLRELVNDFNAAGSGHWAPVGSATEIADQIQERFEAGSTDGFVLSSQHFQGYELITTRLVPELARRGLFRTEYQGSTLRDDVFAGARLPA